jgi:predicted ATPase
MLALAKARIRMRVGIHTGEPALDPPKYGGMDVHRAARIMSAAHGGQVVLSSSTVALLEPGSFELRDLGEHRFKDLSAPERVFQLGAGEFPPIRSLHRTNLPVPATPFLGREEELAAVVGMLGEPDVRLVSLVGTAGTGKTRLALQAAAQASDAYPDGVFWAPLAPLRDPALVLPAVAAVLGVKEAKDSSPVDDLAQALAGQRLLVLVDNLEHLMPDAADLVGAFVEACPSVTTVVTTRERLQLPGEHVYAVPPMSETDGEALFRIRAATVGVELEASEELRELCARLDNLPLALELAAARAVVFSPAQLLDRLSQRLDLLRAGRGVDARQQTLRSTIAWSHDLLDADEQALFRRLSVFAGSCSFESAEQVAGADPDVLQSLLDKSLLRRRDGALEPRFWMLATIREFAAEQLAAAGEADDVKLAISITTPPWPATPWTRRCSETTISTGSTRSARTSESRSTMRWISSLSLRSSWDGGSCPLGCSEANFERDERSSRLRSHARQTRPPSHARGLCALLPFSRTSRATSMRPTALDTRHSLSSESSATRVEWAGR